MLIKKILINPFVFICALSLILLAGCKKESTTVNTVTPCVVVDIRGNYQGTFTAGSTVNASFAQIFKENNFTTGGSTIPTSNTSFGGYSATNDSVKMSTWNSINKNYYYFEGVFSNNRATISGTFKNLTTTSEYGTFILMKQ